MRMCPAVPAASADVSCHVPSSVLLPVAAAFIQSLGNVSVASTVPLSAVATFAGCAPVRILSTALVPIAVSIASTRALRTVSESWIVMLGGLLGFHLPMLVVAVGLLAPRRDRLAAVGTGPPREMLLPGLWGQASGRDRRPRGILRKRKAGLRAPARAH